VIMPLHYSLGDKGSAGFTLNSAPRALPRSPPGVYRAFGAFRGRTCSQQAEEKAGELSWCRDSPGEKQNQKNHTE
uniref:Uncharacterized protein n=1 Tax=Theropithecus gelada TaxID=9565 RepID=A0A8D2K3I6_THEGE